MLPSTSIQAHVSPNINNSLVSIGALCDVECTVTFKIKGVTVVYQNDIILRGWRNHQNKLWYFALSVKNEDEQVGDNKNNLVNNIYQNKIQAELVSFLHETRLSPVKSTLTKYVNNGNFETWPGLTA